jgi:acyl carrier protein
MPRSLEECRRIVASAIDTCSIQTQEGSEAGLDLDATFGDLGFDSLAFMEFCIALQVETGAELTAQAVDKLGSPAAVARRLSEIQ